MRKAPLASQPHSCPPRVAAGWLASWQAIGGGVSIGKGGAVQPWRFPAANDAHAAQAVQLLDDFGTTPGLADAVRAVVRAEALIKSRK